MLFTGTVLDNIAYGIPPDELSHLSASEIEERVVAAAKLANAHDFISGSTYYRLRLIVKLNCAVGFPLGYNTEVGSGGVAVSGGQKQRIAIARALVKKPAVLLLDEATSALDATSERVVQQAIDELQKSRAQTTIVIAHRLSTIRNADKIAVVHNGMIAELGRHDELITKEGGIYKELISLQMSGDDEVEVYAARLHEQEEKTKRALVSAKSDSTMSCSPKSTKSFKNYSVGTTVFSAAKNEDEVKLNADEIRLFSRRIWGLILKHVQWMTVAVGGALLVGCVYPLW